MDNQTVSLLLKRLADDRSGRVVFLSHCLLNENVRYLGGATRPGGVAEITDVLRDAGVGIVQMPCPEERAWGGVLKTRLLRTYGTRRAWWFPLRRGAIRVGLMWTRHVYRRLARQVAHQVDDYQAAGFEVVAVVGVGASPSCGVLSTLDVHRAVDAIGALRPTQVTRETFNDEVILPNVVVGRGLFMAELSARLARSRVQVPLLEHDLVAELRGASSTVLSTLTLKCRV